MNCTSYDLHQRPRTGRRRTAARSEGHKHMPAEFPRMTKARKRVLDFVRAYIEQHNIPPSMREVGDAVGLLSTSTVFTHLQSLVKMGELEYAQGGNRSYRLPGWRRPSLESIEAEVTALEAELEQAYEAGIADQRRGCSFVSWAERKRLFGVEATNAQGYPQGVA